MSFQVCSCGWSKVTTYQGLRIHQGKMGCTPKGARMPEGPIYSTPATNKTFLTFLSQPSTNQMNLASKETNKPVFETPPRSQETSSKVSRALDFSPDVEQTQNTSDMSLQVCSCGWKNFTTHQGLRIHQGKMGCIPKGARIPEGPIYITPATNETLLTFLSQPSTDQMNPASKETNKSVFETPPRSQKTTSHVSRALDFSPDVQQTQNTSDMSLQLCNSSWSNLATYQGLRIHQGNMGARIPEDIWRNQREECAQKDIGPVYSTPATNESKQSRMRADLQEKIHVRQQKIVEVQSSAKACMVSLDIEWLEINSIFSEVMQVVEDTRQKALQPLEERSRMIKKQEQEVIQNLQKEIAKLEKSISEMDINAELEVPPLTGLDESKNWKLDSSFSFDTLRSEISNMMDEIHLKMEKLSSVDLKRIPIFAVDVKLDPTTAHQCLVLSDNGKTVKDGGHNQNLPDLPGRFDLFGSILAINRLSSGKSYWEVEVTNKTGWDLGVARHDANRKGKLSLTPDEGYWVIVHFEGDMYGALTVPPINLSMAAKPTRVGVFVDYEQGLVSFYNVTAQAHIYSFTKCSFGGEILPYFSPHLRQNGKNSDPLNICAVKKQN